MEERPKDESEAGASPERIEEVRQKFIAFQERRDWHDVHEMLAAIDEIHAEAISLGIISNTRGSHKKQQLEDT